MLEIILLIFLCKKIGQTALRKGLKPTQWKVFTVVSWLVCEFAGVMLGAVLFGENNLFGILSLGLVSAFGGYLIVKAILDNKPNILDDEITRIGSDDLRP